MWKVSLRGYLMKKGLWSVVKLLSQGKTIQTHAQQAQFPRKDEKPLGIINISLHNSHVHYVDEAMITLGVWENLEKVFGAKVKHSKMSLKMALYGLMM